MAGAHFSVAIVGYIFDGYLPFVEPIKIIYFPGTI